MTAARLVIVSEKNPFDSLELSMLAYCFGHPLPAAEVLNADNPRLDKSQHHHKGGPSKPVDPEVALRVELVHHSNK